MTARLARIYGRLRNIRSLHDEDFWLVEVAAELGDAEAYGIRGLVKLPRGHVNRRQRDLGILDLFACPHWLAELVGKACKTER